MDPASSPLSTGERRGLKISEQGYDWSHHTMDIHSACDDRDAIFDGVTASTWIPS